MPRNTRKNKKKSNVGRLRQRKNKKVRQTKRKVNRQTTYTPIGVGVNTVNRGAMTSWRIKHREYISDLISDGTGTMLIQLEVNPGLAASFPWLSTIANSFESYKLHGLKYEFLPALGTMSEGMVALCPDFDAADEDTSHSKQELFSFQDCSRGPIWNVQTMTCSGHNLQKMVQERYVRPTDLGLNLDIKTYDALELLIYIQDAEVADALIGELWVEYDITLITPQLNHEPQTDVRFGNIQATNQDYNAPWNPGTSTHSSSDYLFTKDIIQAVVGTGGQTLAFNQPGIYQLNVEASGFNSLTLNNNPTMSSATGDASVQMLDSVLDTVGKTLYSRFKVNVGQLISHINPALLSWIGPTATGLLMVNWNTLVNTVPGSLPVSLSSKVKLRPGRYLPQQAREICRRKCKSFAIKWQEENDEKEKEKLEQEAQLKLILNKFK